jgi:hypothetical protein
MLTQSIGSKESMFEAESERSERKANVVVKSVALTATERS